MKLSKSQVAHAFNLLSINPKISVRQIATQLKVNESSLRRQLVKQYGQSYLLKSKGMPNSLLKLLREDCIHDLSPSQKFEVRNWVLENHELLNHSADVLTDKQIQALTEKECSHSKWDYRTQFEYSEFLNQALASQYQNIPILAEKAEVDAPVATEGTDVPATSIKGPYINLSDLSEVLEQYFEGTLNEFSNEEMLNIYKPCAELSSNSLWGQITTEELDEVFCNLPEAIFANLENYFVEGQVAPTLIDDLTILSESLISYLV